MPRITESFVLKWKRASFGDDDCVSYTARLRAQDEQFCNRLRAALEAGQESSTIGVITEPGTKSPRRYEPPQPVQSGPHGQMLTVSVSNSGTDHTEKRSV